MRKDRRWPSRRLQIVILLVLAIGALIQVFWQPLDRRTEAEKLYQEALFIESTGNGYSDPLIEKALKLDPGNPIYEQALVLVSGSGGARKTLLKKGKLGPEARRLAAGLIYGESVFTHYNPAEEDLAHLNDLQKADPKNSLVHYRKAMIYQKMGRTNDVISEVRLGNQLGAVKLYVPELSREVLDTVSGTIIISENKLDDTARMRELARILRNIANDRLRHGKVDEAEEILKSCARMGVNFASAEPGSIMHWLVGSAIFKLATAELEPIYREFGQTEKLASLKKTGNAFEQGSEKVRALASPSYEEYTRTMARSTTAILSLCGAAFTAYWVLFAIGLLWIISIIQRKRHRESAVTTPPWSTGWLFRMLLMVFVPYLIAWGVLAQKYPQFVSDGMSLTVFEQSFSDALMIIFVLLQIAILALTFRMLHHSHDAASGERTGIYGFIYRSPAAVKAWTRKYLAAAMLGEFIFIACLGLLVIILHKPVMGGHLWEPERYRLGNVVKEQAVVGRIAEDLNKAAAGL